MKLYAIDVNEDYNSYSTEAYDDCDECDEIEKLADDWQEKKLRIINKGKEADLAFCWEPMNHLLLSQRAVEILSPFMKTEELELLPVRYGKKKYYIMHGIKADRLTCDIVKKGTVMRYVFEQKELEKCEIEDRMDMKAEMDHGVLSDLFFTEKFIKLVKDNDLQGVNFAVEWDSEEGK